MFLKFFSIIYLLFFAILSFSCNNKNGNNHESINIVDVNNIINNGILISEKENIMYLKNPEDRHDFINDYLNYVLIYNININENQNNSIKILLNTRDGCSKTELNIKNDFYSDFGNSDNILFVTSIDELEYLRNRYFNLPFLETFSKYYFEKNNLIFITKGYNGSSELRNERIEKYDEKYSFLVEFWIKGTGDGFIFTACAMTRLYIMEISKN